jgi:hypothetical protein
VLVKTTTTLIKQKTQGTQENTKDTSYKKAHRKEALTNCTCK